MLKYYTLTFILILYALPLFSQNWNSIAKKALVIKASRNESDSFLETTSPLLKQFNPYYNGDDNMSQFERKRKLEQKEILRESYNGKTVIISYTISRKSLEYNFNRRCFLLPIGSDISYTDQNAYATVLDLKDSGDSFPIEISDEKKAELWQKSGSLINVQIVATIISSHVEEGSGMYLCSISLSLAALKISSGKEIIFQSLDPLEIKQQIVASY